MCRIKIQTEDSCENTNAHPALPIGNTSALWASTGLNNNQHKRMDKIESVNIGLRNCNNFTVAAI